MGHGTTAAPPSGKYLAGLTLAALGVVYGDIGTSPLYAFRECFNGHHAIAPSRENIFGIISMIIWALILMISVKYIAFVMRADNRGEGGILALMTLATRNMSSDDSKKKIIYITLGLFGSALLFGDGMITPAISVLSAVEGLSVAASGLTPYVIPVTLGILVGLFAIQRKGTSGIGFLFGPICLAWFFTLFALGIYRIADCPEILGAFLPTHAISFFLHHRSEGFIVLGSVFLSVTGGEALYADMGHFGRLPIRIAWFSLVLPALLTNYLGQGALLLVHPEASSNPFYLMAPSWALYPLVGLATLATVNASQALISGVFSMTRQAVQLGYFPRVEIIHTSAREIGQIYIPSINWMLMTCVLGLVLGFKTSSNLAAAYGVSVATIMVITTVLLFLVARGVWKWSLGKSLLMATMFIVIDLAFFSANFMKLLQGGWVPLVIATCIFTLFTTWKRGRQILYDRMQESNLPMDIFLEDVVSSEHVIRVPGTAIFMTGNRSGVPHSLLHNLKHNKVLHERVIFLRVTTEEIPVVPIDERVSAEKLADGFYWITAHFGFMEDPNIPRVLDLLEPHGLTFNLMETTFFLGRETLIPSKRPGMAIWREAIFAGLSRNARNATDFFRLPPNRVVELGAQIEL